MDLETRLKISAVNTSAVAFRDVAQQVEQMTQRVTKSQRVLVDSHKTAVQSMTEMAGAGYTTLGRLAGTFGVGFGAAAAVEAVKKSVTLFANVDQRARALHVSTGESLEKINAAYERVDATAAAARVPVEELRNAFDTLARAFGGVEGAKEMLPGVAQAAAGMHTTAEETALFNTQLVNTLKIAKKDIPAAFDSLIGAAKGGRVQAAELEKGISDVSTDLADIGMTGPKALHQVEAAMETVGNYTTDAGRAVTGVQAIIDAVNTKRLNAAFLSAGINMKHELEKGAKAGMSALDVMVEQAHRAALIIQRRHPGISIEEAYAELTKRNLPMRDALIQLYAHRDVTAQVQERIAKSGGAMADAAKVMTEGMSGTIQSFSNELIEAGEAVGSFVDHMRLGIERLEGKAPTTAPTAPAPPLASPAPPSWWEWLRKRQNQSTEGEKRPDLAPPAPPKKTGKFGDISGNASDIGWMTSGMQGAQPLIPSQPGSTTERTAREQLEVLRRLERSALFGGLTGAGVGGSSGAAAGGGTPEGEGGGKGSGSGKTGGPSARRKSFGHPGAPTTAGGKGAIAASKADTSADAALIRKIAKEEGIDPDTAVAVAKSEGLGHSWAGGDKGSSFGPLQAHFGGIAPGMMSKGQGDAMAREGINAKDPAQKEAVLRWQLKYAKKHGWGEWYGARRAGIGNREGIDGGGTSGVAGGGKEGEPGSGGGTGRGEIPVSGGAATRPDSISGMEPEFRARLAAMMEAAPKGSSVFSGYRSPELQAQLFAKSDRSGHMVARPGHSHHGKGDAADIKGDLAWFHKHAAEYGLRFPMPYENWHIQSDPNTTIPVPHTETADAAPRAPAMPAAPSAPAPRVATQPVDLAERMRQMSAKKRSEVARRTAFHQIAGRLDDFDAFVKRAGKATAETTPRDPLEGWLSTTPSKKTDQSHVIGTSNTPSSTPFPHDPKYDNFARSTMTFGKRQPDEFITHPNIHYDQDQNMPVISDEPMAKMKEKLQYNKTQKYIDSDHTKKMEAMRHKAAEPVRVKVAYDFDAADVRTHNKAYARRSFNKEARNSRYSSYSDQGTPA